MESNRILFHPPSAASDNQQDGLKDWCDENPKKPDICDGPSPVEVQACAPWPPICAHKAKMLSAHAIGRQKQFPSPPRNGLRACPPLGANRSQALTRHQARHSARDSKLGAEAPGPPAHMLGQFHSRTLRRTRPSLSLSSGDPCIIRPFPIIQCPPKIARYIPSTFQGRHTGGRPAATSQLEWESAVDIATGPANRAP
jgi:hypothetical protein